MEIHQSKRSPKYSTDDNTILPDEYYSVAKAARLLGKSRMSLYRYLSSKSCPIESRKMPCSFRKLIKGSDLIAFKAEGLPKLGRRRVPFPTPGKPINSTNKEETDSRWSSVPEDT